ncbi:MAG: 30S ribosomal protein S20 [Thermodesulfobacteriota bacterium]|nr:30S ribosomal protein S20 [Thermodesulfobacteriota bacterium]
MANHKSALKRARQNEIRRMRNKSYRTRVNNVTKQVRLAEGESTGETITTNLNIAKSVIDIAAKKGIIHKKTAARKISRLAKFANTSVT